ncbi:hypothetical protein FS935_11295 [Metabacillus litoralis]|uniref:Uncharacterized protein n=1 Tax=Metabacillus litoralis TaxID=152268 RepID=A0A5C6VY57_9BACI|nr:hypothetical protein [Metabacillus litoralis]TXC90500.1 hypothetical protein FS935_11295 [Metabacillus litoralis]
MSEYKEFLLEKEKIDHLFDQEFQITLVIENLNGAIVDFEKTVNEEIETKQLHIKMAESRKYFATHLLMRAK